MNLIVLIGSGAVGKMTVGQQSFQGVVYARLIAFGKRSSVRSSVKHRLTDVGEIPARATHLDM